MNCFILKSNERMRKGVPWNAIAGFVNDFAQPVKLEPTKESIRNGHLEWLVPDVAHNRAMVAGNYSAYITIETDKQLSANPAADQKSKIELDSVKTENIDLRANMQELMKKIEKFEEKAEANADAVPLVKGLKKQLNNNEIKKEKDALKRKLTAKGKIYPPTASLTVLQDLVKEL